MDPAEPQRFFGNLRAKAGSFGASSPHRRTHFPGLSGWASVAGGTVKGAMGGAVADVRSKEELDGVLGGGGPVVLHFWASWCEASKQMDQVFSHLSADFPSARFLRVCMLVPPFFFFGPDFSVLSGDLCCFLLYADFDFIEPSCYFNSTELGMKK